MIRAPFRKKRVADIRHQDADALRISRTAKYGESPPRPRARAPHNHPRTYMLWFLGSAIVLVIGLSYVSYRVAKIRAALDASHAYAVLQSLGALQASGTPQYADAGSNSTRNPIEILQAGIATFFEEGGGAFANVKTFAQNADALLGDATFLEQHALADIFTGKGNEVVQHLTSAHEELSAVLAAQNGLGALVPFGGGDAASLALGVRLPLLNELLGSFAGWAQGEHRILLMLGNTSEIRPAGGFFGSYADIDFKDGNVVRADVHDINDADRLFAGHVVPPYPLQAIEMRWHIADANWFLNFPDSAKTIVQFLGDTGASSSSPFDAVIAITPQVVEDLFSSTGPITLKDGRTINAKNFMREIQASVEAGQGSHAASPKAILQSLAPALFTKLEGLSDDAQSSLAAKAQGWLLKKDLLLYFSDSHLQNFFDALGWTGSTFAPSADFLGDYFSLVEANIGGGKTDLVMGESVDVTSRIGENGTVYDHVTVTRAHHGDKEASWWYRLPNQEYLEVRAMPDTSLAYATGGFWKAIAAPIAYARVGYARNPLVEITEASAQTFALLPQVHAYQDSGSRVFATWSRVTIGKTDTISLDYTRKLLVSPADGFAYTFVFDKQPGTHRTYRFEIDAPPGFRFRENGLSAFEYASDDPPGQLSITLTLEKIGT